MNARKLEVSISKPTGATPVERKPPSPRSGTADRIVEAALKLFNQFGFRNVSALMIAKHLGMSHGNLAYHFKNKSDIVLAVFPQLEAEARNAKKPGGPFLPAEAVQHQINFGRTLWRYRFFFNALTHMLSDQERLTQRFRNLQEDVIGALSDLLDELIAQRYMRIIEPFTTYEISRACWLMWLSWLRFEHIENPKDEEPSDAALYDAVGLISIILGPYFSPEFRDMMEIEVRKSLPKFETARSPRGARQGRRSSSDGGTKAIRRLARSKA